MTSQLLIARQLSPLRTVEQAEVLTAFTEEELRQPRNELVIDSRGLAEDVEGGHWRSSDEFVRRTADKLRAQIARDGGEVHYFGIVEVPHVLGIAAHLGDETLVFAHDYNRDTHSWAWPAVSRQLEMSISGAPKETVSQSGEVTLVVEVSYPIDQRDVEAIVGDETLASIRITPDGREPIPGIVQSIGDVAAVREKLREGLGAIAQYRPGTTLIHLFIAAPMSVCFAVGQELRLRNGRDVQTYRYRAADAAEPYGPAILLTARSLPAASRILNEAERILAGELRPIVANALDDVKRQAARIPKDAAWFAGLQPIEELKVVRPFASLTPLSKVVDPDDRFSEMRRDADYAFPKDRPRAWEMSDALVLAFYEAARSDRTRMRELVRLFFYHEYLHDWQDLTKYTAEDVGSFANCLEAIDYMADSYALLHQLDYAIQYEGLTNIDDQQQFLADHIGLALASFWAFEVNPPHYEWQERRLRRYLNWYWRRLQMRDAPDLRTALRTLARRPAVEIVGFKYRTGGGRHFVLLNEPRPGDVPEVGLVLEDGRFTRRGTTTDLGIEEVMLAFGDQDRDAIDRFFNSLFEHARQTGSIFATE